jgi:hypothetical protein
MLRDDPPKEVTNAEKAKKKSERAVITSHSEAYLKTGSVPGVLLARATSESR